MVFPGLFSSLGLSLGLLASGCSLEDDPSLCAVTCEAPLTITVHGTATMGTPNVSVDGAPGSCWAGQAPHTTVCAVGSSAGTYDVKLTAPGYEAQPVRVAVQRSSAPCQCGYEAEKRELTLAGSALAQAR